ncbi:VOC family protein [Nesterenkonia pannonica]|uniref:VOC family protein n=1 Tax=Nesterenkonia pannonica TaxID=1548602 RepID=UPI0021640ADF|nr:VOC family protein [Nesterenkonia pannonica]
MIFCLPFLMFQGRAQEAIDLYLETFPDAELLEVVHHPEGTEVQPLTRTGEQPNVQDTAAMETVVDRLPTLVATSQLRIGSQVLMLQDSLIEQAFDFTPSMSLSVVVDSDEDFDRIVHNLSAEGEYLMEPGDYDFAKNYAWVKDTFGVTWQVVLPSNAGAPAPGSVEDASPLQAPAWE